MKKILILIPALNPPKQLIDYVKSLLENGLNNISLIDFAKISRISKRKIF